MFASALIGVVLGGAAVNAQQTNMTLIPSGISSGCATLLNNINSDSGLSSCVQPLLNATASFNPLSNSNLTADDINYTLASICKSSTGCSDSAIRSWLTQFYSACSSELTSSNSYNAQVRELYDILYVVNPLKGAVCSIDSSNQEYCVNEIVGVGQNSTGPSQKPSTTTSANSTSSTAAATNGTASSNSTANSTTPANTTNQAMIASFISTSGFDPIKIAADNLYIAYNSASSLSKRLLELLPRQSSDSSQSSFATIITPNATTYRQTNLPFLFLQPSLSSSNLCTPCTREIMVQYIKWETAVPYALGLAQSPILGGQIDLWNAINQTCGAAFTNAINAQVGQFTGISNSTSGALSVFGASGASSVGTAAAGLAILAGGVALFA